MKDARGTIIQVGDIIAVAVRNGNMAAMHFATVEDFGVGGYRKVEQAICRNEEGRKVRYSMPDRIIIVRD